MTNTLRLHCHLVLATGSQHGSSNGMSLYHNTGVAFERRRCSDLVVPENHSVSLVYNSNADLHYNSVCGFVGEQGQIVGSSHVRHFLDRNAESSSDTACGYSWTTEPPLLCTTSYQSKANELLLPGHVVSTFRALYRKLWD